MDTRDYGFSDVRPYPYIITLTWLRCGAFEKNE